MTAADDLPWFHAALERLDLRRQDRVLVIGCARPAELHAVAALVGSRGTVTVVEPDRRTAEAVAALPLPGLEVLATMPEGERYGSFDALLVAPLTMPRWPLAILPDLVRHNLRPGGRFVVDLPGPDMIPVLRAAWAAVSPDATALQALSGPADDVLAAGLRAAGLRRVETALGAHLLSLASPFELVEPLRAVLRLDETQAADLGRALARELAATAAVEVLVHRTRVHGLR